ncbi:GNAT domain-containing protein [Bisporella sp. PMI_857]|nr:GNAT domain-containing protein [Bisporella sp. PMI_857]
MDTPRLHLRKIAASDLNDFHDIWSNAEATKWSSCGPKKTLEESQSWLNGILPEKNPEGDNYAVFVRGHPHRMIGIVGVYAFRPAPEIGYTFHPDVWGQGYATEAVKAFISLYWELRPSVDAVEAKTDVENIGSIRVLSKCGFKNVEMLKDDISLPAMGLRSAYLFRIERLRKE